MFARNPLSNEHGTRVAFTDLDGRQNSWTGDRTEFLGRNGNLQRPIALLRGTALSMRTGAGLDPCSALQTSLRLKPDAAIEIVFLLGEAASAADAQGLITKYRTADLNAVFAEVTGFWDKTLSTVQVKTPDRALDIIVNRWVLYQTLVCRVWARSGFYQSSGAYGFRDQLQDTTALAIVKPEISRATILSARHRINSPKATSSIGGCRKPDAACAHAYRMTEFGSPTPRRIMCKPPATPASWMRPCRSSRARRYVPASTIPFSSPQFPKGARACSSIVRSPWTAPWLSASTDCL